MTFKESSLFIYKGCYDTMLSHGRRTVGSHRFGEKGSGKGGGAGTSCSIISLETEFASSLLQRARLSSGHQEGAGWGLCSQQLHLSAPCSLPTDDNGARMRHLAVIPRVAASAGWDQAAPGNCPGSFSFCFGPS